MLKRRTLGAAAVLIVMILAASAGFADERGNGKLSDELFHVVKDGKGVASIDIAAITPDSARDVVKAVDLFRADLVAGYGADMPYGDRGKGGVKPNRIELVVEDRPLMTEDETVVDFPDENVMRITGGASGVVRALFYLLEEFGGVRYLGLGGACPTHFPNKSNLAIPRKRMELSQRRHPRRSEGRFIETRHLVDQIREWRRRLH